jgi:hypothetical protein
MLLLALQRHQDKTANNRFNKVTQSVWGCIPNTDGGNDGKK